MKVIVKKLTDLDLMRRACEMTMNGGQKSQASFDRLYDSEHSPIRTQVFWIEMLGIPSFVSVHFVRHKIGVEHFVKTNRDDRGGDKTADRNTPVDHGMFVDAQALINMARKRLCMKAHTKATEVMQLIKDEIDRVDPDLARYMVPECVYRGNICHENKGCGKCPNKFGV